MREITQLVIHHTAGPAGTIEEFRREHKGRGFADIGYHMVIGNGHGIANGARARGRPESIQGAGVYGNNVGKLHVSLVGNFARHDSGYTGPPTVAQLHALGEQLREWETKYHPTGEHGHIVVGHKEITIPGHPTACPGDLNLDRIRRWYRDNVLTTPVKPQGLEEVMAH